MYNATFTVLWDKICQRASKASIIYSSIMIVSYMIYMMIYHYTMRWCLLSWKIEICQSELRKRVAFSKGHIMVKNSCKIAKKPFGNCFFTMINVNE